MIIGCSGLLMKISVVVLAVGCLVSTALSQDCPDNCKCSNGTESVAHCTRLDNEMLFPETVKHLVVDSVPGLQINLTDGFFKNVGLQQVLSIQITNCSITYIDPGAFEDLPQLTDVNLSNNGLILIHPDTFQGNSHLEHLSLSGNPLQLTQLLKAEENYFLNSSTLLELDLSHCQLSDIDKKLLSQVPNLLYVNLKANGIKVIDTYIFENVPLLDEIDLSHNMLISLNDGIFEDIDELTTLSLQHNQIKTIDDLDLPSLKELDVSHNKIKMLTKTTLEGFSDLSNLNISHNEITYVSEEAFKDLFELRHLDLSHNAIQGPLPKFIFEENEYLETLSLGGNKDMHIFEGFSTELPRLYLLDISGCGLSNITTTSFNGMPSLAILNISMNDLTSLNHYMVSKLHRLNDIDVSHNNILKVGQYTFTNNTHLKKLNLSYNKLHHLSPNTFEKILSLTHLDISHNQFLHLWHTNDSEYMKDNSFLNQLEYLNLAGNNLKDLHKYGFSHLTNLKALNILDNPLECTTEFPGFIEWLCTNHIRPLNYVGKSEKMEHDLEKLNLQWDDLMSDVCKLKTENIEIKTKPAKQVELDMDDTQDLNFYQYTVIEDVPETLIDPKEFEETVSASEESNELEEEINTYVWPTFLIVFSIVFLTLAIGNTIALLVYRRRNQYHAAGFKRTFVSPFKRSVVKLDTTPRYHKLYEECSVPNTTIVKSNLLGNLVNSQIGAVLSKPKKDELV